MTFEAPDEARFPALRIARAAGIAGPGATAALIAADDIAVERFLAGEPLLPGMAWLVERGHRAFRGRARAGARGARGHRRRGARLGARMPAEARGMIDGLINVVLLLVILVGARAGPRARPLRRRPAGPACRSTSSASASRRARRSSSTAARPSTRSTGCPSAASCAWKGRRSARRTARAEGAVARRGGESLDPRRSSTSGCGPAWSSCWPAWSSTSCSPGSSSRSSPCWPSRPGRCARRGHRRLAGRGRRAGRRPGRRAARDRGHRRNGDRPARSSTYDVYDDSGDLIVAIDGQHLPGVRRHGQRRCRDVASRPSSTCADHAGETVTLTVEHADGSVSEVEATLRSADGDRRRAGRAGHPPRAVQLRPRQQNGPLESIGHRPPAHGGDVDAHPAWRRRA